MILHRSFMGKGDRRISAETEARCLGSGMSLKLVHKTEKTGISTHRLREIEGAIFLLPTPPPPKEKVKENEVKTVSRKLPSQKPHPNLNPFFIILKEFIL